MARAGVVIGFALLDALLVVAGVSAGCWWLVWWSARYEHKAQP